MNRKHSLTLAVSLLGLVGTLPSAWAGLNAPVIRQDANIDPFLSTAGTQVAAANLGSAEPVNRNGVTFPAVGTSANPAGTNWSVFASTVDQSLGGSAAIDPLFFSESWGGNPVTLSVTNLDAGKTYLVQILHGEPRSCCSGTYSNNDFLLSNGATLDVPDFTIGNGVAAESPPAAVDRAIVEVELGGVTSFTYRMKAGTGRGPSIAGFQVRELPGFTSVPIAGLPGVYDSSVAWGDYDNDGRLDFLLTGSSSGGTLVSQLWRNTGSGFTDVTASVAPGLPGVDSPSVAWGDYDNDGLLDFLLTGLDASDNRVSQLWRNTGSGFTNVTASVAPGLPGVLLSSVAWGDYDNDGRLDFLLTGSSSSDRVSQLWRNTGSGFTNETASVVPGLPGVLNSSVAWGDYDNDGRLDFLLTGSSSSGRVSQVWRNTGSGFTNVTATVAPGLPGVYSSSVAWGDYDNDGRLDFLLMGWTSIGGSPVSQLWRNTGSGFTNVTSSVAPGLSGVDSLSVAWGDYDNDGLLDFLLTGYGSSYVSQLWRNNTLLANIPPTPPTGLSVAAGNAGLTFSWNAGSDSQTPANGLAYHLRIGTTPGGSDLLAPMAAADGQPRLPRSGAPGPSLSRTLKGLTIGQPIYWSVQAADTGFAASAFATEQVLTLAGMPIPANGTYTPGDTNGDGVVSQAEFAVVVAALGPNELATQNAAGYYTQAQVQSLNVGTPLISQVSPGRFRLTLGVQKSTNLTNPFTDFSLATPGASVLVNPEGKLEFEFPATDNAAFFRIEAK